MRMAPSTFSGLETRTRDHMSVGGWGGGLGPPVYFVISYIFYNIFVEKCFSFSFELAK